MQVNNCPMRSPPCSRIYSLAGVPVDVRYEHGGHGAYPEYGYRVLPGRLLRPHPQHPGASTTRYRSAYNSGVMSGGSRVGFCGELTTSCV